MIVSATIAQASVSQRGDTRSPILVRLAVNITSGTIAKGSWKLRTTWLRISSRPVSSAPQIRITASAGMIAMTRVISRRATGLMRQRMNPSITIWPDMVAVIVAFSPQHSSASPNSVGAMDPPRSGVSSACAWSISTISVLPVLWNVAAARIRIEALTHSANISAIVESHVAIDSAARFSAGSWP